MARKALAVGIDKYPDSPLDGCAQDAEEFAKIMRYEGEDDVPNFDVLVEKNTPTRKRLYDLIKALFAEKLDTLVFYFSGHGVFTENGGSILTPDHESTGGVSMDVILNMANRSPSIDKIILLDCCNSGEFGATIQGDISSAAISRGVTILTASNERDPAFQVNGRGVFTNLLLDALEGGAADLSGNITPGGIYTYIDQALGGFDHQRPVFKTNVSRFTILRKVKPQVPRKTIKKIAEHFPSEDYEFPLDPSFEDTNVKNGQHRSLEPYADKDNVSIFKELQKLQSIGLVVPVSKEFMYFEAMDSGACKLTTLGRHYWRLVTGGKM